MTPCTPAPPCDTEFPLLCEPLELTSNGKRIIVEDSAACQKTLANPSVESILAYDSTQGKLKWIENTFSSCDPFATSTTATKVIVEESNGCKKTLANPTVKSILSYDTDDNKLKWIVESNNPYPAGSGVLSRNLPADPVAWVTGTTGQFLKINSSGFPQFETVVIPTPTPTQWITVSSNATIISGQQIFADTTTGPFTLNLPASPASNSFALIADRGSTWAISNLTVNRNGQTIEGLAEDLVCNISGKLFTIIFNGLTWKIFTV
jgi:hypothetical protein